MSIKTRESGKLSRPDAELVEIASSYSFYVYLSIHWSDSIYTFRSIIYYPEYVWTLVSHQVHSDWTVSLVLDY